MDFKFGGYIYKANPNKSPLKILEKRERGRIWVDRNKSPRKMLGIPVVAVGVFRESRKFLGHACIGAHCAVIFAIAQLSCFFFGGGEKGGAPNLLLNSINYGHHRTYVKIWWRSTELHVARLPRRLSAEKINDITKTEGLARHSWRADPMVYKIRGDRLGRSCRRNRFIWICISVVTSDWLTRNSISNSTHRSDAWSMVDCAMSTVYLQISRWD